YERVVRTEVVRVIARGSDVVAEGERRQRVALPRRAERRRDRGAAVKSPPLVRALEATAAQTPQQHVAAGAQYDEVGDAVAVDVDRVRAEHAHQIGRGARERSEAQRAAGRR